MKKYFTGIGSRETPEDILLLMTEISKKLTSENWILRSGGALGADEAFQKGVSDFSEIYLPYKNFRRDKGILGTYISDKSVISEAMYIVSKYNLHENWNDMINNNIRKKNSVAVAMHTRNVFQILGSDLKTKTKFVICWTKDGANKIEETSYYTGGTRTAIRLAIHLNIPVFNLNNKQDKERILNWLKIN